LSDFSTDLADLTQKLKRNRIDLLSVVQELNDTDLGHARRGGWDVARVLEHIVGAEWHYAQLVAHLRGRPPVIVEAFAATTAGGASGALERSRAALLGVLEGVSEDDFYRLGTVGREEYSIVSVLENAEQHDAEHLGQIRLIQNEVKRPA
jgi:hypothetical protein